jgi:Tfp pilus assembly protein PilF
MRAMPHGAKHVPIPRPRCDSPGVIRPVEVAGAGWPRRISGMCLMALLAVGFCGCNSMSGNLNNQVGMWNYQQGNYHAAREEFYRAAADDPQNASFSYNLACAMRRQGDLAAAEESYMRAIHADPSHQPSYHALAELMIEEGRRAEATQLVSSWTQAQPYHAGAQIEMAWIQRENGDMSGAEQSLYRSLAARPNNPIATAQLGQLYQEMGQTDRAAVMYRRSLQADWLQPQVQSRLATLQNPNGWNSAPPTMFASNFGGPAVTALPFPASTPAYGQVPPKVQTALAPSQTNDDPAHIAN